MYIWSYALFLLVSSSFGEVYGLQASPRYNETCYLVAHNAFANKSAGWLYRQQNWGIKTMLEKGVRGFMLDIHPVGNKVYLCHGGCSLWVTPQKGLWATVKSLVGLIPYEGLDEVLTMIKDWLNSKNNKHEIITLFFENYVGETRLNETLKTIFGEKMIFTPADFDASGKKWPFSTYTQDEKANSLFKRLICFNEAKANPIFEQNNKVKNGALFFPTFDYIIESSYGVVIDSPNKLDVCFQRDESAAKEGETRYLFLFNYFSTPSTMRDAMHNNQMHVIGDSLSKCQNITNNTKRPIPKNMKPNFIALDFVDQGDGKKFVDLVNEKASMKEILDKARRLEKGKEEALPKSQLSLFFRVYQQTKKLLGSKK